MHALEQQKEITPTFNHNYSNIIIFITSYSVKLIICLNEQLFVSFQDERCLMTANSAKGLRNSSEIMEIDA